jgi:hypothetical protein
MMWSRSGNGLQSRGRGLRLQRKNHERNPIPAVPMSHWEWGTVPRMGKWGLVDSRLSSVRSLGIVDRRRMFTLICITRGKRA